VELQGLNGLSFALTIQWVDNQVEVVSFRRGEWECELLAMARAGDIAVH